jgi:hypothetical protein
LADEDGVAATAEEVPPELFATVVEVVADVESNLTVATVEEPEEAEADR